MCKIFSVLLCALMLAASLPLGAAAAETAAVAVDTDSSTAGADVFNGYDITILDTMTPAVNVRGRTNDRTVMCFVSADNQELGVISYSDYWAISAKYRTLIRYADGSSQGIPPDGYDKWNDWFADAFNKLRALDSGSREEAVEQNKAETTEEYRQELIRLVNLERENAGLPPYVISEECMEYSQLRAEEIKTLFSHTRPDGTNAGYEIISAKSITPVGAVKSWMESIGHKSAILSADHSFVGAGCYITSNGGVFWEMFFALDPELHANSFLSQK